MKCKTSNEPVQQKRLSAGARRKSWTTQAATIPGARCGEATPSLKNRPKIQDLLEKNEARKNIWTSTLLLFCLFVEGVTRIKFWSRPKANRTALTKRPRILGPNPNCKKKLSRLKTNHLNSFEKLKNPIYNVIENFYQSFCLTNWPNSKRGVAQEWGISG